MDIKSFESFEKRLADSKCPEHFFGILPSNGLDDYIVARNKENELFKKITQKPLTDNQKNRISYALSRFLHLDRWGLQKISEGVYGNNTEYRLKLLFEVKKLGKSENLYFFLLRNGFIRIEKLWGFLFGDGYLHSDDVHVLREGVPIRKGYTSYYGTHAATVCFYGIEKDPTPCLTASSFVEHDIIEINTWEYASFDEFIRKIK